MKPAEVTLESDTVVRVARTFDAPARMVWRAYTEPQLIQRWMLGPPGWSMPVCEMDLRVGGQFQWRWQNDADGTGFGFHGEFREVKAPTRIVHTEVYDPGDVGGDMGEGVLVTVTFDEAGGKTTMVTRIEYQSKKDRDAALSTGMTDGMEMSYKQLDDLISSVAA